MARRQATRFSLSVSRARECALSPSFRPPSWPGQLARTFARPALAFSLFRSLVRFADSPLPSRAHCCWFARSPPPPLSPPRTHTYTHTTGTHRFLHRLTARSPSACRRMLRRIFFLLEMLHRERFTDAARERNASLDNRDSLHFLYT